MTSETFSTLINNDKALHLLLNENEITGFSDFSKIDFADEAFKTYIEDQYIESFKTIYNTYAVQSTNAAKTNAFLRSTQFLATKKAIEVIAIQYHPELIKTLDVLKHAKETVDKKPENFNVPLVKNALNVTILNICNRLDSSEIIKKDKNQLIAYCLYICDVLEDISPKHYKDIYVAREDILKYLQKIDSYSPSENHIYLASKKGKDNATFRGQKPILEKKVKKRGVGYYALIALGIAYFLFKLFRRMG